MRTRMGASEELFSVMMWVRFDGIRAGDSTRLCLRFVLRLTYSPSPYFLLKVFKVDNLSPDFGCWRYRLKAASPAWSPGWLPASIIRWVSRVYGLTKLTKWRILECEADYGDLQYL
jgi:hypothetical protein